MFLAHRIEQYLVLGGGDTQKRRQSLDRVASLIQDWGKQLAVRCPEHTGIIDETIASTIRQIRAQGMNPLNRQYMEDAGPEVIKRAQAMWREGLEELELLGLLANLGGEAVADEITASICNNVRDFSRDPHAIDFARTRVIEEILKLKQE